MLAEVGAVHGRGGTLKEAFERTHAALVDRYGRWPIFEHCLPFDVSRLWDELSGVERPVIWTVERDREVWDTAAVMNHQVAVIGNGPVGQTTALLLARWGVPTVVLDQRPARDASARRPSASSATSSTSGSRSARARRSPRRG